VLAAYLGSGLRHRHCVAIPDCWFTVKTILWPKLRRGTEPPPAGQSDGFG
jgi:hypothetical protein